MVAVLEVAAEERPALMYELERLVPLLARESADDRETGSHLAYMLRGLAQAPAGPGEIEMVVQDVFVLGTHNFALSVDLEEYWLDLKEVALGREAVDEHDPEVTGPAARYFPEMVADPLHWKFVQVEGQFTDLGFKLDRLLTQETPRARGLYNKTRGPITNGASERRKRNAALRYPSIGLAGRPDLLQLPATAGAGHEDEEPSWPRPVGSMRPAAAVAASGLSVVSRATFPGTYEWGVETSTGINADTLAPDKPVRLNIGGAELLIVNCGGTVCAATRTCPHRGWDLSKGTVAGGAVTCPLHGAQFNLFTGAVEREPFDAAFNKDHPLLGGLSGAFDPKHTTDPIESFPTRVADDGEVFIRI